jgi:predicted amidohydrolase
MKVAVISARPEIAKKKANIEKIKNYVKKTKADLYIFGELFLSGYRCKDELRTLAEPLNGPSIEEIKKIARQHKCYIIFGMPLLDEKMRGIIYNAAVLVHPDGKVNAYKKWFLPTFGPFEEKIFFDEGEDLPVFKTKYGKIGILICYDLYFPEICKAYSLQGADIIVCISASPNVTRKYFETLLPARAIENTVFMIYSNLVSTQEDLVFWGGSQIYDPLGNLLKKAPYFKESIIEYELDLKQIKLSRAQRPVLRDVKPEIYNDLYQMARKGYSDNKKILQMIKRFHGHLGPYAVIGWKAGCLAREILGSQHEIKDVKAIVYTGKTPYSCMVDGLQLSSNCTYGKRNVEIVDNDLLKIEFKHKGKEGSVILEVKNEVKKDIDKKMTKENEEELAYKILLMPNNELFEIEIKD